MVFMDPVVKPRGDTQWILPVHAGMTPRAMLTKNNND
ncbi:MAG: hypothetical protein ACEY3D_04795 [Rickettsia sp.]